MTQRHDLRHRAPVQRTRRVSREMAASDPDEVMAAALPCVDDVVAGHSLTALEHLAAVVRGA